MKKENCRTWLFTLCVALTTALTACQSFSDDKTFGAMMGGVDHLADYLSVSDFSVNGAEGFQAGAGGAGAPSPSLPRKWYPGMTVHVKWDVSDWKHENGSTYEADVPVDPYSEPGNVWVHFLANGTVRVVIYNDGPSSPNYPGPHDPILDKHPWDDYPQSWVKKRPYLGGSVGGNGN